MGCREGQFKHGCSRQQGPPRHLVLPQVCQAGLGQAGLEAAGSPSPKHCSAEQQMGPGDEPVPAALPAWLCKSSRGRHRAAAARAHSQAARVLARAEGRLLYASGPGSLKVAPDT